VKRFLIAVDGSSSSQEAVRVGVEYAAEQEAEVTFFHVVPPFDWSSGGQPTPHKLDETEAAMLKEATEVAEELGISAKVKVASGDPVAEIVSYADSIDADMIVVGSRGLSAVARVLLGSVSRGVLYEAQRPVLLVKGAATRVAASTATGS
jgi:nucleotide-binding universal stress UspA family protein